MSGRIKLFAMDLEGVLIPEVWIAFAEKTAIPELRLTTRDIADYDQLMKYRLDILKKNSLRLADIQAVIEEMEPLPGALEFLAWLKEQCQYVILSDTFYEFAAPFMRKLGNPLLLCNSLEVDESGNISDYKMRLNDGKRHAVLAFKQLNFDVLSMGDSFNDTTMLLESEYGILFRPSDSVREQFPQLPVAYEYEEVKKLLNVALNK